MIAHITLSSLRLGWKESPRQSISDWRIAPASLVIFCVPKGLVYHAMKQVQPTYQHLPSLLPCLPSLYRRKQLICPTTQSLTRHRTHDCHRMNSYVEPEAQAANDGYQANQMLRILSDPPP